MTERRRSQLEKSRETQKAPDILLPDCSGDTDTA